MSDHVMCQAVDWPKAIRIAFALNHYNTQRQLLTEWEQINAR